MNEPAFIRVVVVDDHPLAQAGARHFLSAYPDMQLVGTASSASEAVEVCTIAQPDVVLMDVMMPGVDGIATTQTITKRFPGMRVVVVSSFGEGDVVQRALQAGAVGYLLKNATAPELARAIRDAYVGRPAMAPEATEALIQSMREPAALGHDLTERERTVLHHMAQGFSNAHIAGQLSITPATVKFHISSIFSKLGVSTRAEVIALAYQKRLV